MITINICVGSACHLKGSYKVINNLQRLIEENNMENKVEIKAAFCLGECTKAVSVRVDEGPVVSVSADTTGEFFNEYVVGRL